MIRVCSWSAYFTLHEYISHFCFAFPSITSSRGIRREKSFEVDSKTWWWREVSFFLQIKSIDVCKYLKEGERTRGFPLMTTNIQQKSPSIQFFDSHTNTNCQFFIPFGSLLLFYLDTTFFLTSASRSRLFLLIKDKVKRRECVIVCFQFRQLSSCVIFYSAYFPSGFLLVTFSLQNLFQTWSCFFFPKSWLYTCVLFEKEQRRELR